MKTIIRRKQLPPFIKREREKERGREKELERGRERETKRES
jgi:hypothetical protein